MENLGRTSWVTDINNANRIQETDERISGVKDTTKEIETKSKNPKHKILLNQNIQEIQEIMKRPNLRMIGIENEKSQLKWPENTLDKT